MSVNSSPWSTVPKPAAERTAFKSDVPWPSDYPDELAYEEYEEYDEEGDYYEDENGVRWGAPVEGGGYSESVVTTPYAAAAKAGLPEEDTAPPLALTANTSVSIAMVCRVLFVANSAWTPTVILKSMRHIERCHAKREREARHDAQIAESADVDCVVCMETVKSKSDPRFGLLGRYLALLQTVLKAPDASHVSLDCEHCSCPICRTVTHFVTPSAIWPTDAETKEEIVAAYKNKLGTIDCKHYNRGEGSCPFGTSCFYRHVGRDGIEEEVRLRKVMGNDAESLTIVSAVKLADFLDAYEGRA
ncbi:hypothetical protein HDU86_004348 [Geranomyces michiganensis]|nr:hypothetical protein HDU86_004348 [Geranomyces michiganensis]